MQELSPIEPAAARFDLDRLDKFSSSMQDLALTNVDITKWLFMRGLENIFLKNFELQ